MARLVIVAPGRGTYNRAELGYLGRFADHPRSASRRALAERADALRRALGRPAVTELDAADAYSPRRHLPGEHASSLIFTCAAADLALIAPEHEVTAVLGNSMGWYTTLYAGGALDFDNAFRIVDAMGWQQKENVIGGQIIYPVVDERWRPDPAREAEVVAAMAQVSARGSDYWVGLSIRLGGFLVIAGEGPGLKALLETLPQTTFGANEYPFQLGRHSAFHTPLMKPASERGLVELADVDWRQPATPMIDGAGGVWRPRQTDVDALQRYTLSTQVQELYDFSAGMRLALREHNPDHVVLLGPGETLGGAIAHVMIAEGWRGIDEKRAFADAQKSDRPPLIALNRPDQAAKVI